MNSESNLFLSTVIILLISFGQPLISQQLVDIAKSELLLKNTDISIDNDDIELVSSHISQQSGLTHFYFNQTHNGIKIYNAVSNVAIGKDSKVFAIGNRFVPFESAEPLGSQISASRSLEEVAKHFQLDMRSNTQIKSETNKVSEETILKNTSLSARDISASLMYVHVDGKLHLCWSVAIEKNDDYFWWDVKVSAIDGSIIDKTSWTVQCNFDHEVDACDHSKHNHNLISQTYISNSHKNTNSSVLVNGDYQVFAMPTESPNHGNISIVNSPWNDNLDPAAHPFDWHNDGATDYSITRGNNVFAAEDRSGDNQLFTHFSPSSQISPGQQYIFTPDFDESPENYQAAAITNLFYWNNINHDIMYHYGFDEGSGNFQFTNDTNSGTDGDPVVANAQDGSGINNATFSSPPDGTFPRMTMFEWTQSGQGSGTTFNVTSPINTSYQSIPASFTPSATFSGQLVETNDTDGGTHEACSANPISNGGALNGRIALIDRGNCNFTEKIINAEAEGAIAVVICNNVAGNPISMGGSAPFPNIPSVMISQDDCTMLRMNLPATIDVETTNSGPPNRDSDYDNVVITHEYGHGISTRLTGGRFNSGCLNNEEQMGEGWSDYFGLILTMTSTDTGADRKGIGTYLIGQSTAGPGIRQFPYSTNFNTNPLTYADSRNASVPHGVGTVWATALWEMTWDLIDVYGIGTDIYDSNINNAGTLANPSTFGGQNLALQLVIEGLKLQPCRPGFVDGRDAILAADKALYGGIHEQVIWEAFARRGLGLSASQGSSDDRDDNEESFDLPDFEPNLEFTSISGSTRVDTDGNGIIEASDPIIDVEMVYRLFADSDQDGLPDEGTSAIQTITTMDGNYVFETVAAPGDYVVIQTQPEGHNSILDVNSTSEGSGATNHSLLDNLLPVSTVVGVEEDDNNFLERLINCQMNDLSIVGTTCNDPCFSINTITTGCECIPATNVALSGSASMSSMFNSTLSADNLIDGVVNNDNNELAHTSANATNTEWQEIDLGDNIQVSTIVIRNRTNCCSERLNNVYLLLSNTPFPSDTDLGSSLANAEFIYQIGEASNLDHIGIQVDINTRYIRVQKSGIGENSAINLREIQVFSINNDPDIMDEDNDGICDSQDVCPNLDDNLIGTVCDDADDCTAGDVFTSNCLCEGTFADADNDGICDAEDDCNANLEGQACDDGDDCTTDDLYDVDCVCSGIFQDTDNDGICDAEDCVDGITIVDEGFNDNLGSFSVVSGAFSTPNPVYESFMQQNGSILLGVGGVDNSTQINMSLGVSTTFTVSSNENITIEINYVLNANAGYEDDEWTQALAFLDGQPLIYNGNSYLSELVGGSPTTTGTQIVTLTIPSPSAGTNTLTVGLLNNKKTFNTEFSSMVIDNISIVQDCPEECPDHFTETTNSIISENQSANISITTNGRVLVGDIDYYAGQEVNLKEGFEVTNGAIFHAYIAQCN